MINNTQSNGSSGSGNPWDVSPAVTASQSELSSNTHNSSNNLEGDVAGNLPANPTDETGNAPQSNVSNAATVDLLDGPVPTSSSAVQEKPDGDTSKTESNMGDAGATLSNKLDEEATPQANTLSGPENANSSALLEEQQPAPPVVDQYPLVDTVPTMKSTTSAAAKPLPPDPPAGMDSTGSHSPTAAQQSHEPEEPQGGRLWQAALLEATESSASPTKQQQQQPSQMKSKFAESIMERTRSRADPNALVKDDPNAHLTINTQQHAPDPADTAFILNTALAKKRVRVVQLLLIGLVGLLLGLLGNFFVSTSCHFATVNVLVGQNNNNNNNNNNNAFEFHFGLWKYTPIDSVFQGYSYCYKYDGTYNNDAPVVARIANISALVAGLIAISVLWAYLIVGYANKQHWQCAVGIAGLAGVLQLLTLVFFFFVGDLCSQQGHECHIGPGAYLSIFTSVVWVVLACEMHYHTPIASYAHAGSMMDQHDPNSQYHAANNNGVPGRTPSSARSLVQTVEMTNVDEVAREYILRVTGPVNGVDGRMPSLSRTADLTQRSRSKLGIYAATPTPKASNKNGNYQPPMPPSIV